MVPERHDRLGIAPSSKRIQQLMWRKPRLHVAVENHKSVFPVSQSYSISFGLILLTKAHRNQNKEEGGECGRTHVLDTVRVAIVTKKGTLFGVITPNALGYSSVNSLLFTLSEGRTIAKTAWNVMRFSRVWPVFCSNACLSENVLEFSDEETWEENCISYCWAFACSVDHDTSWPHNNAPACCWSSWTDECNTVDPSNVLLMTKFTPGSVTYSHCETTWTYKLQSTRKGLHAAKSSTSSWS